MIGNMEFYFGDIVVVEKSLIGVVVKCWDTIKHDGKHIHNYDVYVRMYSKIINYEESQIQRYAVRHKYLNDEESYYQHNAYSTSNKEDFEVK